jgi:hypothetical protein
VSRSVFEHERNIPQVPDEDVIDDGVRVVKMEIVVEVIRVYTDRLN